MGATSTRGRWLPDRETGSNSVASRCGKNFWVGGNSTISTLFPLVTSEFTEDVVIENLVLDGNGKNNTLLDGNYAGCIFLQDCNRYTIRNVEARHYNGDGIGWQISHDVLVENCHSHDHTGLGFGILAPARSGR